MSNQTVGFGYKGIAFFVGLLAFGVLLFGKEVGADPEIIQGALVVFAICAGTVLMGK